MPIENLRITIQSGRSIWQKQEEKLREERLKAKASLMEACNEDALNALKSDETVEEREDSFQELFSEKGIDELEIKEDIKDAEG